MAAPCLRNAGGDSLLRHAYRRRPAGTRIIGEVAELLGLPKPAGQPTPETTEAATEDGATTDAAIEDLAASIESIIADAARLLAASALDEDFLQFTAPRPLPLLDGTPQAARLVRFAPATARQAPTEAVTDGVAVNDVAWTASGETVGVIRLVPVRPGLLRANGTSAASAETVIAIDVTCGGDHTAAALAEWMRTDDQFDGCVMSPEHDAGPIIVHLPPTIASKTLVRDVTDWLHSGDEATEATVTSADGRAASVTAAELQDATEDEIDAIVARIVSFLGLP